MKRVLTVALGAALCMLATAADARPSDFYTAAYGGDREVSPYYSDRDEDGYSRPRSARRSARNRHRRHQAARAGHRRHAAKRSGRRQAARAPRRAPMAQRSFMRYAGPGTSRGCLTPAASALLGRIEAQFGRVQIISTCRPGARIAGTNRVSRHASGNAVDFNAPGGRKAEIVRWLIANHRSGGTMTYAGMGHIHVDIGPRFVSLGAR
jgi:uncharacterized protein YcbK (DUF882 family)